MVHYYEQLESQLTALKRENRYRVFVDLERIVGQAPYALWYPPGGQPPKKVVVWCSNDYLGMSHHPHVIQALTQAGNRLGVGSGGTRNISGTTHPHVLLEQAVAALHDKEQALLFTSGYVANEATLSALVTGLPNAVVVSDEKNHASIIQGIRLSRAEKRIFKHNDLADLRHHLALIEPGRPKIIAFVSVYSMDGDLAPIEGICDLAEEFNALTYLDEVHAVGLYGPGGAGVAAAQHQSHRIDVIQANFAKAYGVVGGYIAGRKSLVDYVRSTAEGFIFTTSLPPGITMAALTSLNYLRQHDTLRQDLWERVDYLKQQLATTDLPVIDSPSHIVPMVVGDAARCKALCETLLHDYGIYIQPINYPTVPRGQERLRLTVTPAHTPVMIDQLVTALQETWCKQTSTQAA